MLPLLLALLIGCKKDDVVNDLGVAAIVDPTRAEHYFDLPFPSDDLLDRQGFPDLSGYPVASTQLAAEVFGGWATRIEQTTQGFGNNTAAYFRFSGPLDLPDTFVTEGTPSDDVLLVALDGSEQLPVEARFIEDPAGDPFYGPNTLAMAPLLGAPPVSGGRYAAVVMRSAGATPAAGYSLPDGVQQALDTLGVSGQAAVATVFTVQDGTDQLRQLRDDVDARLPSWDWGAVSFKRVVELEYAQGLTPSGKDATLAIARFEDGMSRTAYLAPDPDAHQLIDLLDWPMAVYEGDIPVMNYQGLDDRPYMQPSFQTVLDVDRMTGWIDFEGGTLVSTPEREMMRITVSIPKGADGEPITDAKVLIYDHGTSGHAYNAVQRRDNNDRNEVHAQLYADAGFAVIGRDAPLYGTRYPLIDEGYGGSLGFYNVVNLPAFRDNQRQTAVDGHTLLAYVRDQLNDDLPAGGVDSGTVRRMGHSLGSVTSNLGLAMEPDAYEATLLSGTGGVFTHYFLDTGLLEGIDPATIAGLFPLFGVEAPDEITINSITGAALGLPQEAWPHIDRLHPALTLFQWTMDPSDPMAIARDETSPTLVAIGIGDYQVPNFTSEALAKAQPNATVRKCHPTWDYDPHQCLWREQEGFDILEAWLNDKRR